MQASDIIGVIGGLALFLYGMRMMSDGLSLIAGSKMKQILEKLTRNPLKGLLVGILIAAIIQSSNATTVMVVGFVNAGLMDLSQAVGVIVGAKVGTTMTGQLIAFNVSEYAPVIAFVGVAMISFIRRKRVNNIGMVIAGLGILFIGMSMMSTGMAPLKEEPWFQELLSGIQNPVLGLLAGVIFTALIQSSSASVGVLQAMAAQGVLSPTQAAPLIYGINIGACISAVLASLSGKKDAKRAAMLSVIYSTIGALLFLLLTFCRVPFVELVVKLTPDNPLRQIANIHTLYNVICMLVLAPCSKLFVKISRLLVPGEDDQGELRLVHISRHGFAGPNVVMAQVDAEVTRMARYARDNFMTASYAFFESKDIDMELVNHREEIIDYLNKEITDVLVRINASDLSEQDARRLSKTYHVLSDLERIGDHALNIAEYASAREARSIVFSGEALAELRKLMDNVAEMINVSYDHFLSPSHTAMSRIEALEQEIDDQCDEYAANHVDRLSSGACNAQSGLIFCEILTDLERVSDHALNIAQAAPGSEKKVKAVVD